MSTTTPRNKIQPFLKMKNVKDTKMVLLHMRIELNQNQTHVKIPSNIYVVTANKPL